MKETLSRIAPRRQGRNGTELIRSLKRLPRKVMTTLSSPRSPKAACSVEEPMVEVLSTKKPNQVGYADLTQMSVGFQAGLQDYCELIVFENQAAMDRFKRNEIDFGANASAVLAEKGAAMNAQFVDGVAVFVRPTGGRWQRHLLAGNRSRTCRNDRPIA